MTLIYGLGGKVYFENSPVYLSKRVKDLVFTDLSEKSVPLQMVKLLRKLADQPVYIGHTPLGAAKKTFSTEEPINYIACVNHLNEAIYKPFNAELIAQPAETIVNGNRTHPDFTKGSKRLSVGDKRDDEAHSSSNRGHMNDEFGRIWLNAFLKKILTN